jgi:hypothetical protein
MGRLRRVINLFVHGRWSEAEMDPSPHTTIDPERLARIQQAVTASADTVAASQQLRAKADQATVKLATAVRQATGVIGTDLLADRPGRLPKPKGHHS